MSDAFFDYPVDEPSTATASTAFLADASDADWAAIRAHCEVQLARAGEVVLPVGDLDPSLYIVLDGELEAIVDDGRRAPQRTSRLTSGAVLGEISFLDGGPRSAAVRAVSDATLLRLHRDRFEILAAKEPVLARTILLELGRVVAARLRAIESLRRRR